MNNKIINLTDENFYKNILESDNLVLVDFWAEWCAPCKIISPILDEISDIYKEKITIAKVNIDQNPEITNKYNIRSIPTLLLFNKGNLIANKTGILTKMQLKEFLNNLI